MTICIFGFWLWLWDIYGHLVCMISAVWAVLLWWFICILC